MARQRREDTDIDHFLYPKFDEAGISRENIRRNITTTSTGRLRGDIWIADVTDSDPNYDNHILALVECKDHFSSTGDEDWQDAIRQGEEKARLKNLNFFFVTNTQGFTRCYNRVNLSEVSVDGRIITEIQPIPVLRALQAQVNQNNSNVLYRSFTTNAPDPKQFRASLWTLRQVFRSRGISKGSEDSMIKTSLSFCILKVISEQQSLRHTIPNTIFLWDDWRPGQMDRDIRNTINDIVALPQYRHLDGCLAIDNKLDANSCNQIFEEISNYMLYGSDFDFFGLIYEALANTQLKKDFGEFYTPRHIIRTMVKLLLKDEVIPRKLSVCDPACGTGGFLVEALLFLQRNYRDSETLTDTVINELKTQTFHGYDTNAEVAIPFARTNMIMADDGGTNITKTRDSLIDLPENQYDYILANVPYGDYDGLASINQFSYTNHRRYELLFTEKIVKALKPGGKASIIVPDGLIDSTSNDSFRMKLLHDATIDAVISLPNFVFEPYTTEKTYILFFTKKRPSQQGVLQTTPIWHYIVDHDGFQKGKKRYPINENDLPEIEQEFLTLERSHKSGLIDISNVSPETFYSFCSEFFLSRDSPIEIPFSLFESILKSAEKLYSKKS